MSSVHYRVFVVKTRKDLSSYVYCKAVSRHASSPVRWMRPFHASVCNIVRFDRFTRNNTPLAIRRRQSLREVLMYVKSVSARRLLGITIAMTKNLAYHVYGSVSPIVESLRYFGFEDRRFRNESFRRYRPFVYVNAQCVCLFLTRAMVAPV